MCGIVGYIGKKKATPILISGLEKLEYRGYDSSGIAIVVDGKFQIARSEGKLINLKTKIGPLLEVQGENENISIGLGHTRWATHGRPSETNAHPHVAGKVCVVHNGIIENYLSLRSDLEKKGCNFESETDTEIAAHLVDDLLKQKMTLVEAVGAATKMMKGSYALVCASLDEVDRLVVAKNATPVVIGLGTNENFIASDIPGILEHTRDVVILEDGDLAELTAFEVKISNNGVAIERDPIRVTWDPISAEKGGYEHFMLKEIHEQPIVATDTFRGRLDLENNRLILDEEQFSEQQFASIERVCISACGTAWHAGLVLKFFLENLARIPCEVDYASEFRYRNPVVNDKTLFVAISQSGETADTLGSLELAKTLGAKTIAICNVVGTSIARKAEQVLYTQAGPEISVASTKAFIAQLIAGLLLSTRIAVAKGKLDEARIGVILNELIKLPALLSSALEREKQIEAIAKKLANSKNFLFIGRGRLYPIALEGALKLKEISYIHAEGYPAGELKHGPISLVDANTPVVAVIGHDGENYEKTLSNITEIKARGGIIVAVTDYANDELKKICDEVIELGEIPVDLLPIVLTVPLQLFAYYVAVARGTDVDQPRNLAKSVTVE
jgi:glucosamine--fructose-6-phosphate aminotransferase (isomerizing)